MPVRYENPSEVGADRIVNSVAAYEIFGGPVIAVDFGTATTFDCVSKKGEYMGGCLFPGIHISMDALFERTSKLPRVEIARPKHVIGKTTTGALQSGLLYGYAGMVDSMVERIQPELGDDPARVIATGGLAGRIARESNTIEEVVPFLTLEGLRILFEKNR
jgi:type III pantothenate kinase